MKKQASLLDEYDSNLALYSAFRVSAETALKELIRLEGIRIHSVTSRTKARDSFFEKLDRDGKSGYEDICDITDIVGIRVITHMEDEVDRVGDLIKREFFVDINNSVDKRQALDPDRFGYLSLHFVCCFSDQRVTVPENRRFSGLKFEVQIRSILQHAWAEIEHDLGYKVGAIIPATIRRRFSRLAGLLEIADDEFRRLRDELDSYRVEVPKQIENAPSSVALDNISLASFIATNKVLKALDGEMAKVAKISVGVDKFDGLDERLNFVGIFTIQDLAKAINKYEKVVLSQWKKRLLVKPLSSTTRFLRQGISLYHLWQVIAVSQGGVEKLREAFSIKPRISDKRIDKVCGIIEEELKLVK